MLRRSTRIAIAAIVALLLAPAAASGQESTPEEGEIGNGTAKATAMVARIGPGVGDLELAIRAGLAVTQVTNRIAQSTSQTLDLGLIGTSLTAESCNDAILTADQLPQSTNVDNRQGAARLVEDEGGMADAPVSVGHKDVEAGIDPVSARATTTAARFNLPGGRDVLRIDGGQANAVTEVLPGQGRQATATVNASVTIGPLTLGGLEWRAFHRTGVDPHAEASFRIASIAGMDLIDIPLDNLYQAEKTVNGLLAPLGVTLEFPRVERFLEPTDLIRITPLRISIRDMPLGLSLIAPLKVQTQEAQDALFQALTEAVCEAAAVLLVGDIALSVVAGTGFLTLEIGGAEAISSKFVIKNPFGSPVPPSQPPATAPPAPPPSPQISTAPLAPVTSPPTSAIAAPPTQPSSSSGPLEEFCASVHPNGGSCEEGAALALGLLGVLVTIAVAGYEVRKQWPGSGGDA